MTSQLVTRSPMLGIGLALLGALIITPDTLLIRFSGLEGWPLTASRGLLIGGAMLLCWMIISGRQMGTDLKQMLKMPFLVIMPQMAATRCVSILPSSKRRLLLY